MAKISREVLEQAYLLERLVGGFDQRHEAFQSYNILYYGQKAPRKSDIKCWLRILAPKEE